MVFKLPRSLLGVTPQSRRRVRNFLPGIEVLEVRTVLAADLSQVEGSMVQVAPFLADSAFLVAQFSVQNSGDQSILVSGVTVEGVLSSDQVFGNGDDIPAGSITLDLDLAASTALSASFSGTANVGDYRAASFLLLKVDSTELLAEGDEGNNVIAISLPELPTFSPSDGVTTGRANQVITVDPLIEFFGAESADYTGGRLTVSVVHEDDDDDHDHEHDHGEDEHDHEHQDDGNILSVQKTKTSTGTLRRKKNELRIGRTTIGIIGGGTRGAPLQITFNRDVSSNDIGIVAAAVTLRGKKGTPGVRTVQFQFYSSNIVTGMVATKVVSLS